MNQETEINATAESFIENKQIEIKGISHNATTALGYSYDTPHIITTYEVSNRTIPMTDAEGKPILDEKEKPIFTWRWYVVWYEEWITIETTVGAWSWMGALWFWSFVAVFLLYYIRLKSRLIR